MLHDLKVVVLSITIIAVALSRFSEQDALFPTVLLDCNSTWGDNLQLKKMSASWFHGMERSNITSNLKITKVLHNIPRQEN